MASTNLLQTETADGLCSPDKTRQMLDDGKNMLFFRNNLHILRTCIPSEFVDLIYIDPPFNSNKSYNILFEQGDVDTKVQEQAYEDTWKWNIEIEKKYEHLVTSGYEDLKTQLDLLRDFILISDAIPDSYMAYIVMMATRLVELKRVLKSTGSIFLHCDPTMSHYLKIIMDAIFGKKNFRNEIVWCYAGGGIPKNDYPRKHDIILRYTKTQDYTFNVERKEYGKHIEASKRRATSLGGKRAVEYSPEGTPINDWWDDISPLINWHGEKKKVNYPTQKPLKLVERIVKASSNEGDIILDAFCGSGTTMVACSKLNRKWIGIDLSMLATGTTIERINDLETDEQYYLTGFPQSMKQVKEMIRQDTNNRFKLEYWVNSLLRAVPNKKQRKDGGVDGTLFFRETPNGSLNNKVLIQVKTGKVGVRDVRELLGVMDSDDFAHIGYLVCLEKANITEEMKKAAAKTRFYDPTQKMLDGYVKTPRNDTVPRIPRFGIITIEEIIESEKPYLLVKYPRFVEDNQTFYW